jgi:ribosomal protein S18 acetylase RimI-like enzyme
MVRLDRGGADFLTAVTRKLADMGASEVYSPALYPGSTRVWVRSGYVEYAALEVMERSLATATEAEPTHQVALQPAPDWGAILDVDRIAFEGFWGMSLLGLREAHETNRSAALLTVMLERAFAGYAIVGTQWAVTYLHRIAVRPELEGRGLGASLLHAAFNWGRATGGRSIILNVRAENHRAIGLYRRCGFTDTGTSLRVLRHREQ